MKYFFSFYSKRPANQGQDSERLKIRKKKKFDRQKMIEQAHEEDKNKWQSFANKVCSNILSTHCSSSNLHGDAL